MRSVLRNSAQALSQTFSRRLCRASMNYIGFISYAYGLRLVTLYAREDRCWPSEPELEETEVVVRLWHSVLPRQHRVRYRPSLFVLRRARGKLSAIARVTLRMVQRRIA